MGLEEGTQETGILHIKREVSTKKIIKKRTKVYFNPPPQRLTKTVKLKITKGPLYTPRGKGRDQALLVRVTVASPSEGTGRTEAPSTGQGKRSTRPLLCTLHNVHKELTGVAHGHVEALAARRQFWGHRAQVSDRRGPGGLHGWRDRGWRWRHHDHHHGIVGEGHPGGRSIGMEARVGSEIGSTP